MHEAAWSAGEAARAVATAAALAAQVAYLRCAAPDHTALRDRAATYADALNTAAAALQRALERTELPLVVGQAGNVAKMISLTPNLQPVTTEGYRQLGELARDLASFLESPARRLDQPPPSQATSAPSAEENALLAKIIADPADHRARLELAELATRRGDPRGELVRLQLAPASDAQQQRARDLVRMHPQWSEGLRAVGARDVGFAGGFPDEITIDAGALLARSAELFATAPLTKLHVRGAAGRVAELVRAPWLAQLETLDLDDQGVTDEDVVALAGSPNAARLRQLDLRYNPITARGIEALAASPHLRHLEVVNLDGNPADPVDRLEELDEGQPHAVPTEAGAALETKYGPLRWLRRG